MGSEKSGKRLSVGAHVVGDGGVEVDPAQGALVEVQLDRQLRPNPHGPGLGHVVAPPLLVSQTRHRHHVDAPQRFRTDLRRGHTESRRGAAAGKGWVGAERYLQTGPLGWVRSYARETFWATTMRHASTT